MRRERRWVIDLGRSFAWTGIHDATMEPTALAMDRPLDSGPRVRAELTMARVGAPIVPEPGTLEVGATRTPAPKARIRALARMYRPGHHWYGGTGTGGQGSARARAEATPAAAHKGHKSEVPLKVNLSPHTYKFTFKPAVGGHLEEDPAAAAGPLTLLQRPAYV